MLLLFRYYVSVTFVVLVVFRLDGHVLDQGEVANRFDALVLMVSWCLSMPLRGETLHSYRVFVDCEFVGDASSSYGGGSDSVLSLRGEAGVESVVLGH